MTDIPNTRRASENVNRLRQEAFAKEAGALRQEVINHFREQTQAELNSLRSELKKELSEVIKEAVTDQRVKEIVRTHLTDQLLSGIAERVARKIGEQLTVEVQQAEERILETVRKKLLERWTKEVSKALKAGFEHAFDEFSSKASAPSRIRAFFAGKKKETEQGKEERAGSSKDTSLSTSDSEDENGATQSEGATNRGWIGEGERKSQRSDPSIWLIVVVIFLGLALLVYAIWYILTQPPHGSGGNVQGNATITEAPPPLGPPSSLREFAISDPELQRDWMNLMEAAWEGLSANSTTRQLVAQTPFNKQFSCWFNEDTRKRLEEIANFRAEPEEVPGELEIAFTSCLARKPELDSPTLAIFSAQATVAEVISRYRGDWDFWCASGSDAPPPSQLTVDGVAGQNTYDAINLFLKCRGYGAQLSIGTDSRVSEYLYITYLALRELQRE